MAEPSKFQMRCANGHEWIETYPTGHTLFGVCPGLVGSVPCKEPGKVVEVVD